MAGLLLVLGLFASEAGAQQGKPKVPPQLPPQAAERAQQQVAANTAPSVSLAAPASDALYTAPATVALEASAAASSNGREIAKVEFFADATLIGTTTVAPYAFSWTPVAAGTYSLTARATDNLGAVATSAPVSIVVNAPPTVDLTAPGNNTVFTAPAIIELTAVAADSDGLIAQLEFYQGTTLLATVTGEPYSFSLANVPAGNLTFTARATDNRGAVTTSTAVAVLVNAPPTVSLTSPAGDADFRAPASITIAAEAADSDGTIDSVQFYDGTNLIATVTSSPYSINWTGVPAGTYTLTARVTDNLGAVTISDAATLTVTQALAQIYYIHTDHLNTPRAIYDQQQRLVWRWDQSDPFGGNPPNEDPSGLGTFTCNLRLPGQYFDKETNLHYNYFRDYDPAIGRYVQSDPIGIDGGINSYLYALDPLTQIDPMGLMGRPSGAFTARAGPIRGGPRVPAQCFLLCIAVKNVVGFAGGGVIRAGAKAYRLNGNPTAFTQTFIDLMESVVFIPLNSIGGIVASEVIAMAACRNICVEVNTCIGAPSITSDLKKIFDAAIPYTQ